MQHYLVIHNPHTNGLVECMNVVIKGGIRKCLAVYPKAFWWEVLPNVLRGIQVLPTRALEVSPHVSVFKQYLVLLSNGGFRLGAFIEC